MSLKQLLATALLLPLAAACSSSPTTGANASVLTYKDCVKNTSEYLVGVTYSCTPHPCPVAGTQCPDVYHAIIRPDPVTVRSSQ
jgi:hypothetical protein